MSAGTRRRYTEDFKREAVRLVRESAHPVAQVARDLGISDNVLSRWRAQHRQAEAHGTIRAAQRAEAGTHARDTTLLRQADGGRARRHGPP